MLLVGADIAKRFVAQMDLYGGLAQSGEVTEVEKISTDGLVNMGLHCAHIHGGVQQNMPLFPDADALKFVGGHHSVRKIDHQAESLPDVFCREGCQPEHPSRDGNRNTVCQLNGQGRSRKGYIRAGRDEFAELPVGNAVLLSSYLRRVDLAAGVEAFNIEFSALVEFLCQVQQGNRIRASIESNKLAGVTIHVAWPRVIVIWPPV